MHHRNLDYLRTATAAVFLLAGASMLAPASARAAEEGGSAGTLALTNAAAIVAETGGSRAISIVRSGGSTGSVSVHYETVPGTASSGADYGFTTGTVTWPAGVSGTITILVPILDDSAVEGDEAFTLHLSSPTGGATLGNPDTATITITDDDGAPSGPGTIHFSHATSTVNEASANATLTVERTGGTGGIVSVSYATANGSATAGSDYSAQNGVLTWGSGDSSTKSITVPISADSTEEPSETFTATLSAPTGGATIGSPGTQTVTITDDDGLCTPCVADATTLCLAGGSGDPTRFRIRVTWENFEHVTGAGKAVPFGPDSGFFYFFSPNNLELLVKMVNACSTEFESFWFFSAAATNVALNYEVQDTDACVTRHYTNLAGNFDSFGDIEAFDCP